MNWLTKFFSKKPNVPVDDLARQIQPQPAQLVKNPIPQAAKPLTVQKQNLTIEQLEQVAPLRDLD